MKDLLISAYIDDELDLHEKTLFVEAIHAEKDFKERTVALLNQEQRLRAEVVTRTPESGVHRSRTSVRRILAPFGSFAAGLAAAMLLILVWMPREEGIEGDRCLHPYRFVIFQPDARRVELAGSFNAWRKIPLNPAGRSGYWEITLDLPEGDHRFSYIIEGNQRLADPTLPNRETDDFGGENSILTLKQET